MTRSASAAAHSITTDQEEGLATLFGDVPTLSALDAAVDSVPELGVVPTAAPVAMLHTDDINPEDALVPEQRLPFQFLVKRVGDILSAIGLLLLGTPAVCLMAILLKLEDPSAPVFTRRPCIGMGDRAFEKIAFRHRSESRCTLPGLHPLITASGIGVFCDVLHVFVGDMSFIGPRLLTAQEATIFQPTQLQRFHVLPGIMGLEQAITRGHESLSAKTIADIDNDYVQRWCLALDCAIVGEYWSRLMNTKIF
jgi:lipopolysaccharide/colanic/teichoic acid biosynthesis glycosyltransferase